MAKSRASSSARSAQPAAEHDPPQKTTSFVLGEPHESFIRQQVAGGRFKNASAVVRAALAEFALVEARARAFEASIQEGLDSPLDKRSAKEVFAAIRNKHFR